MPFKYRLTPSGKLKQLRDEASAWGLLIDALAGTPNHAQVNGLAVRNPLNVITGVNTGSPNFPRWRDAHKRLTLRARRDRQREQQAVAAGGPYHATPGVPLRVDPALVIRDTVRVAALHTRTSEDHGGGTMLQAVGNAKATLAQLHQHLEAVLTAIEDELLDAATHHVDHDLRAAGHAPLQILLATEWYFRIPNRPFTQAERDGILTSLQALSLRYPEWLIVPGSIYWSPDPLANASIRVFNQAPAFYGEAQLAIRTKRESHDIDSDLNVRAHERWGPDYPTAVPLVAPPATITAASQALCDFPLRGRNFCVEICRDQFVGDATKGYLNAGQPGADVFLFLYNGTTPVPGFLPVVHNGIAVYCDGTGPGAHQFLRVTRAQPLTHNWAGPAMHPFLQYRNAFEPERDHDALSAHGFNEARLLENQNDPNLVAFLTSYDDVYVRNMHPAFKTAIDGPLGLIMGVAALGAPVVAANPAKSYHEKGLRIQRILAGGVLPAGGLIPPAQIAAATPYATALVQFGSEEVLMRATTVATGALKTAAQTGFAVNTAALNPGVVPIPGFYDLTLYQLQDL